MGSKQGNLMGNLVAFSRDPGKTNALELTFDGKNIFNQSGNHSSFDFFSAGLDQIQTVTLHQDALNTQGVSKNHSFSQRQSLSSQGWRSWEGFSKTHEYSFLNMIPPCAIDLS